MNPYFEQVILSASPVELVRLMYQRAIALVTDARDHLKAGRIKERGLAIKQSLRHPDELMVSLIRRRRLRCLQSEKAVLLYAGEINRSQFQQKDARWEKPSAPEHLADAWKDVPEIGASAMRLPPNAGK